MEVISNTWHLISAFIVFVFGIFCTLGVTNYFKVAQSRALFLYAWHTLICIGYMFYSLENVADSTLYYIKGEFAPDSFSLGTRAVEYLVYIFRFFELSYLGVFLVFNIFGSIGLLAFYASLNQVVIFNSILLRRVALLIVLLPSVSFWSSAIGKDSLSFLAIGLALWSALALDKRVLLMTTAILIMLFVRPHMAGMLIIAIGMGIYFSEKITVIKKMFIGILIVGIAVVMVPFALKYAGLGQANNINDIEAYIDERQGYNQSGGGGVDIASMSLPMQLFTYLLRPLPYEAQSIPALAASIDNLILLILIIYYFLLRVNNRPVANGYSLIGNRMFMWSYIGMSWFILASTTANLGISVRQKWMFAPILIFLLISYISSRESNKE
ncbi:hypothetical protein [Pseudoalteromonas sp. SWYJZ12]|uniref:hypothetical protein n=1 Tax=Pseudoalteromonas sp. SWYJZ12 TaxID=2792067 RepID=UPI0018CFA4C7|nr:hypothetical protein [Pseudoalteromonas sp. SWYJZ12]MBH0002712.1 hypothetical protein [Pseudoalteromonas sp. SWYJZ12]